MQDKRIRLERKNAQSVSELMHEYIVEMKLSAGLNTRRIFEAWEQVSGAAQYTSRQFFRDGTLYVTLSSSVVRNSLSFRREDLIAGINKILEQDELFVKNDPRVQFVSKLVLR